MNTVNNVFMEIDEEKYEHRRLKLIELRDSRFYGVNAALAREIDRDETYENRLFYSKDKKGRKRLGDDLAKLPY